MPGPCPHQPPPIFLLPPAVKSQLGCLSDDSNYRWHLRSSVVAQIVKSSPAMKETWVRLLGWEDPLEEGTVTHSSILAWRIPMDRGARWATVHGCCKELDKAERLGTTQRKII